LTLVISLMTPRTKSDADLKGLVYSLTPKLKDEGQAWYSRPAVVGTILLIACVILISSSGKPKPLRHALWVSIFASPSD